MTREQRSRVEPFKPDDVPGYLYRQVADHIEARIRAGELPHRCRLPGERDLAVEYGVSVGTIRRATRALRDRGMVATLAAKGSYVTAISRSSGGG
ncbi:winged helix-turn-helix domain-containing protein [Phytoactinopolyspora limicola]|uniref:winged helix-turn-helix domain-containing protein n=1 Tax=Phytoactinopolyspora limicola TaxID=2715536 RepID=UPI0014075985|nr:winged helix-turn-helix domain-containing protein [Phytoactinopolyspora limicola]